MIHNRKLRAGGMRAEKNALSFSWDVPYAYLLNISNDSNHGERCCRCVLYPILYVCYETRLSQQTHTLQLEGWKEARNSLLGLRLIIWCRDGTFYPHREAMMMFTWHRNTRPADDDSALRSLADYSACSSFDALFSTNTHLSFFLLFTAQHDSMFFRFFLYDSSRLYWIQEKNLCCYYLKSFFFACKSCDFWGEGEELQRFYFSLLLRVLLTTIWQWESQKQFLVWWNPADRQLDNIASRLSRSRSLRFLSGSDTARVMWKLVGFVCDAIKWIELKLLIETIYPKRNVFCAQTELWTGFGMEILR